MIHLHAHSHYSVLDGLGTVDEIIERCKAIKAPAVAITDHASISALPDLFKKAKAAGVKPIIGCEFYLVDKAEPDKSEKRYHLTVLAKSWAGVQSIIKALTLANKQFYKRPRLTIEQALTAFTDCVVMSACTNGILIRDDYGELYESFSGAYQDFYLEVMPHNIIDGGADRQHLVNMRALGLWKFKKARVVATNDAHYVNPDDAYPHEVLLAIQSGKTWDDPKRWRFTCDGLHMRSIEEMVGAFGKHCPYLPLDIVREAMLNTLEIARKCNVALPAFPIQLPKVSDEDDEKLLSGLLATGWNVKIKSRGLDEKLYRDRLVYEIGVIKKLNFTRYFLIVQDIIRWARDQGIAVGPGRGSAAGSLVCYLLDITQLDPIVHKLYFERFLNPERLDYPDIDVDFCDDRRQEVFDYIRGKYGTDRTANINTFGVLTVKSAFRDTARVFGVNILNVNALSKLIQDEESFEKVSELTRFAATDQGGRVVAMAKKLSGRIRQNGVHAAGIVLSDRPLSEVAVIEHRKDADVINWDMKNCEVFGLIKIDVLGLSTLSVMDMAAKLVKRDLGRGIDFTGIPLEDAKTMHAFSRGDTIGVFQFEGNGIQGLLRGLQAHDFETITAATALFRPGPLNAGLTEQYLRISKGDEREWYDHELLKPILSDTKGVVVYQEQVMRVFADLAGFTIAEADKMRKIIGKKLGKEEFEKHREHFVKGAEAKGIAPRLADGIFSKLVEFAGYGFNRAHAAAYSMISLWTQYLKTHYPLQFMAGNLTYTDKKTRLSLFVRECKRLGIEVKQPDINRSTNVFEVDVAENSITAPLGMIKGVGSAAVDAILKAREERCFLSMKDFQDRINKRACHKGIVETLVRAGAFESLGIRERDDERRIKNFAELMPIFSLLPGLNLGGRMLREQMEMIEGLVEEVEACRTANLPQRTVIRPHYNSKGQIMVVNNPVKRETKHFASDGSKYFLTTMKALGFTEGNFYYTAPIKCRHDNYGKVEGGCQERCLEFLKREIALVKPKLIICFASSMTGFFTGDPKAQASKLRGQAVYNKALDTYVLFSPSPQYAYFQESAQDAFKESMEVVRNIFAGT